MKRIIEHAELHVRSDGRTVDGRIIPYNEIVQVFERHADGIVSYREQFLPRSCLAMAQAVRKRGNAAFIAFNLDHEEHDFDSKIGYATDLRDEDDGAYATFKLYDGNDLDKVRSMLTESHTGLCVSFADLRPPDVDGDLYSRKQVHIDHVAATPTPVYAGAAITGMRSDDEFHTIPTPRLDDVNAWLAEMRGTKSE